MYDTNKQDRLISISQVVRLTGFARETIYNAFEEGTLPFELIPFGKRFYARLSDVEAVTGGARREASAAQ